MSANSYSNTSKPGTICYTAHGNLYLNITNRCTARCVFCVRDLSDGVYGYNLRLLYEPSVEEIKQALEKNNFLKYREIVFTGFGEPTVRLDDMLSLIRWLKGHGAYVRLDTNGHAQLLYPNRDVVKELKDAGLDAISVSLNAESEDIYNRLCQPRYKNAYQSMLDFTKKAVNLGMRTRMTVVGFTEIDIEKCKRIADNMGADFHVR
ncbi:Radical SAM domain protein [Methanohalobium evestigatum Z-7303]|uniref:Radical SAM domain protein n=1 Tax=Methanohalobium evestigatum (strain ATCC BAA-1072 / DSM 3721 / NBRC 107634 / OCM 161 / Z-7303) TaxID=644295 RepID=D7EAT2_METEZ|nr:TatD family nuclease-associated radical SAM protein [Methanohalobium evestigatum]ADI74449.1 Radical SAM domain protein [Methanohalobium evestigatum Z-7303]